MANFRKNINEQVNLKCIILSNETVKSLDGF